MARTIRVVGGLCRDSIGLFRKHTANPFIFCTFAKLILSGSNMTKQEISDVLDSTQKRHKIDYQLKKLKDSGKINFGEDHKWILAE
jgi:hypothetical protein